MKKNKKCYKVKTSKNNIGKISLVKDPAIQTQFIKMSEENEQKLIILSNDKMIVSGPVLIPNQQIYRSSIDGYIEFDADVIDVLQGQYMKKSNNMALNIEHSKTNDANGYVKESWITGNNDKSKDLGYNLPQGSWMMTTQIQDEKLWNQIKSGEINGYSIEAMIDLEEMELSNEINNQIETNMEENKNEVVNIIETTNENIEEVVEFSNEVELKVSPKAGESESDFVGRCIPIEIKKGHPQSQAVAMCYSQYKTHMDSQTTPTEQVATDVNKTDEQVDAITTDELNKKVTDLENVVADLVARLQSVESMCNDMMDKNGEMMRKNEELNEQVLKLSFTPKISKKDEGKFLTQDDIKLKRDKEQSKIMSAIEAIRNAKGYNK